MFEDIEYFSQSCFNPSQETIDMFKEDLRVLSLKKASEDKYNRKGFRLFKQEKPFYNKSRY